MCDWIAGRGRALPLTGCCQGGMWGTPALTLVEDTCAAMNMGPAVHAFLQMIAVHGSMALTQQLCAVSSLVRFALQLLSS